MKSLVIVVGRAVLQHSSTTTYLMRGFLIQHLLVQETKLLHHSRHSDGMWPGWPLLLLGLLLSVCISLIPATAGSAGLGFFGALSVLAGLLLATYGCGELSWVHSSAQRNSHVTRQQTADFLRIMPTLAAVNLAFNSVYNCMAFWFQARVRFWGHRHTLRPLRHQEQACLMDVRVGPLQLNGS